MLCPSVVTIPLPPRPGLSLPFSLSKLSLPRDSCNWDSRATVASSSCLSGLLFSGTLTSLKDVSGRGQQVCVAERPERRWTGRWGQAWAGNPPHCLPGITSSCLSWLRESGMESTGNHLMLTPPPPPQCLARSRPLVRSVHQPAVRKAGQEFSLYMEVTESERGRDPLQGAPARQSRAGLGPGSRALQGHPPAATFLVRHVALCPSGLLETQGAGREGLLRCGPCILRPHPRVGMPHCQN